jgi:hypothetical protein
MSGMGSLLVNLSHLRFRRRRTAKRSNKIKTDRQFRLLFLNIRRRGGNEGATN